MMFCLPGIIVLMTDILGMRITIIVQIAILQHLAWTFDDGAAHGE